MTITKEGSLVSFYTVNKAPIKHLKVYFSPKQTGTGDPSSENVRTIRGQNELTAYQTSNLFSITTNNWTSSTLSNNVIFSYLGENTFYINGKLTSAMSKQIPIQPIHFNQKTSYILNIFIEPSAKMPTTNSDFNMAIIFRSNNTNFYTQKILMNESYNYSTNFIWSGQSYDMDTLGIGFVAGWENVKIHINIYPNIHSSNYTVDWSSIGSIYGGYIDLITGELVQEYGCIDLNTLSFNYFENVNLMSCKTFTSEYDCKIPEYNSSFAEAIAEKYKLVLATVTDPQSGDFFISASGNLVIFSDIQPTGNLVYKINTPITYQLTPQQITTFIGRNNIWSNADRVEVEYDLAESNDELYKRRNILLKGYPHIESKNGNLINFSTDLIAPLNESKIYFNPVQMGSGDPSTENVRAINGWAGLKLFTTSTSINLSPSDFSPYENNNIIFRSLGENIFELEGTVTEGFSVEIPVSFTFKADTKYNVMIIRSRNHQMLSGITEIGIQFKANGKNALLIRPNGAWENDIFASSWTPTDTSNVDTLKFGIVTGNGNFKTQIIISEENINSINIPFNNTIYGGYIDLVSGKLIQEFNLCHWDITSEEGTIINNTYRRIAKNLPSAKLANSDRKLEVKCNILSPINTLNTFGAYVVSNTAYFNFPLGNDTYSVDVCYPLKTPIEYQLTPQQLTALKGVNNIWSNANGPVEISYWTH